MFGLFMCSLGFIVGFMRGDLNDEKKVVTTCQKKCEYSLNTIIRLGNTTHQFTCACDNQ